MSRFLSLFFAVAVILSSKPVSLLAQIAGPSDKGLSEIDLSRLSTPQYPLLARQARITGDVALTLRVRRDGSVESAVVVSGHPMLRQAAQESAQQSQFDCRGCNQATTSYSMVYTFELGETRYCSTTETTSNDSKPDQPYPSVTQSQNHVTVFDRPMGTCDPAVTLTYRKVRSAKCLYLWKCSQQEPLASRCYGPHESSNSSVNLPVLCG